MKRDLLEDRDIKKLLKETEESGARVERPDGGGLRFRADAGRGSFWLYYRTKTRQPRRLRLGDYSRTFNLTKARKMAERIRAGVHDPERPQDPQGERLSKRAAERAAARAAEAAGVQPARAAPGAKAEKTFADVCAAFVTEEIPQMRPASRRGWVRYVEKEIVPVLGHLKPEEITAEAIADARATIANGIPAKKAGDWKRKAAPVSAGRMFEVLRRILTWLSSADPDVERLRQRYGLKRLEANPATNAGGYRRRRRKGKKSRMEAAAKAFTDNQLRRIFSAAETVAARAREARLAADRRGKRTLDGPTAHEVEARAFENLIAFVAHTGVRAHDARGARWEHVDEDRKLWTVPEHKTSDHTGAPHLVPLSDGAISILARIKEANLAAGFGATSEWLFPAKTEEPCEVCERTGHLGKNSKPGNRVKTETGINGRGLLHRMRDTLKTRASEHGIDSRVSEAILGHVPPGIIGVYDHAVLLPQRREALAWWAAELARILAGQSGDQPSEQRDGAGASNALATR